MPTLYQVRVAWTGAGGLPGVTTHYLQHMDGQALADLRAFYAVVGTAVPIGVAIQIPGDGTTVDTTTGLVNGVWSATKPAVVSGSVAGGYAAPAGACVWWNTGAYVDGRQVRGKTFLVPLASAVYDGDGTMKPATVTSFQNAAATLIASTGVLTIYARKSAGSVSVLTATVSDKIAVLRSRRD